MKMQFYNVVNSGALNAQQFKPGSIYYVEDSGQIFLDPSVGGGRRLIGGDYKKMHPRNLLDNSDFSNPVNQRNKNTYVCDSNTSIPCIDRWNVGTNVSSFPSTLTINDGYVTLENSASAGYIETKFSADDFGIIADKYTMVIYLLDGTVSTISITKADINNSILSNNYINFSINSNSSKMDIKHVALYEGSYNKSNYPPYISKGFAVELIECQRYYMRIGTDPVATGYIGGGDTGYLILPIDINNMRIAPTVIPDSIQMSIAQEGVYSYATGSIVINNTNSKYHNKYTICFIPSDGFPDTIIHRQLCCYCIASSNTNTNVIEFSAEP